MLDSRVNGFFYLSVDRIPHYGRFIKVERPRRLQHTWVSPNTLGQESFVSVTIKPTGRKTLFTLVHRKLPDHELAWAHKAGWEYFFQKFREHFDDAARE